MLENESGHKPIAYVKSERNKNLLEEGEKKVIKIVSALLISFRRAFLCAIKNGK